MPSNRRIRKILCVGLAASFNLASATWANADIVMERPEGGDGAQIVGDAKPLDPSAWPATWIFHSPTGSCTSTLIGEGTILTAAHCIADGGSATIRVGGNVKNVKCDHHPTYDGSNSYDYALCNVSPPIQGVAYETLNTSSAYPRKGQKVGLLGYGCISDGENTGQYVDNKNKVLYGGNAEVSKRPSGSSTYFVTKDDIAGCFGDSGGSGYIALSNGRREVAGVMSRSDIDDETYLSATAVTSFIEWAVKWSTEKQTEICGINLSATGCRN